MELLFSINVDNADFKKEVADFEIKNEDKTEFEQQWEGLGEKIMGIKIVYQGEMKINNIELIKISGQ